MPCTEAEHEGSNVVEDQLQGRTKTPQTLRNRTLNARSWIFFISPTTMLDELIGGQPDEIKPSNATVPDGMVWNE